MMFIYGYISWKGEYSSRKQEFLASWHLQRRPLSGTVIGMYLICSSLKTGFRIWGGGAWQSLLLGPLLCHSSHLLAHIFSPSTLKPSQHMSACNFLMMSQCTTEHGWQRTCKQMVGEERMGSRGGIWQWAPPETLPYF